MAPEVLLRDNYTHKADVFSFGIVLYELFSGLKAYSSSEYSLMSVPGGGVGLQISMNQILRMEMSTT